MCVLVVDGNADNAESLCLLLRLWGYEAVCADSGPEALSLAQQFRPEAAIVEMLLPGLGGDEVGRRLRAMPGLRRGPLIALSGCAATRRQALEAGFDLFLLKPAEPDDIRGALGSHGLVVRLVGETQGRGMAATAAGHPGGLPGCPLPTFHTGKPEGRGCP